MNWPNSFIKTFIFFCICIISIGCKKTELNATYNKIESNTPYKLNDVSFLSPTIGFICGGDQFSDQLILHTTDGGENWDEVNLPNFFDPKELNAIQTHSNGTVVSVGMDGLFYISKDSGQSWQSDRKFWEFWQDVDFKSPTELMLCGGISFRKGITVEASNPFVYLSTPIVNHNFEMNDVDFPSPLVGYISGYGAILKTVDGGLSWNFTPAKNDQYRAMTWLDDNSGIAVGREGSIIKTENGGTDWTAVRSGNNPWNKKYRLYDITHNSRGEFVSVGEKGCILFSQKGDEWKEMQTIGNENLNAVDFITDDTFIIVGEQGSIYKVSL